MEKVIKRNRKQVPFDAEKIKIALRKANSDVQKKHRVTDAEIDMIAREISELPQTSLGVEAIQNIIEEKLIDLRKHKVVSAYITYRYKHKVRRESNSTDNAIFELLGGNSEYWNTENSNKNAKVVTTQRVYIAGIASTDISERLLLPADIVKAHKDGIIHFHDIDYYAQNALHNCDLINDEDCLQNGTRINGVMIERPHWLSKATTILTQLITAVASSQYGGCSINLSCLAPFVRESYNKYVQRHLKRGFRRKKAEKLVATSEAGIEQNETRKAEIINELATNNKADFASLNKELSDINLKLEELTRIWEEAATELEEIMRKNAAIHDN